MRAVTDVGEFRAGNADLPLKNRVWGFRTPARYRARRSASQVLKSRRKNAATATTIASGLWVFLQTDPLGPNPSDMNLYVYVGNNAINRTDPSGKLPWPCPGTEACEYYRSQCDDYSKKAYQCCKDFGDNYTANCVRGCLIAWDQKFCANETDATKKTNCRKAGHVECYLNCNAGTLLGNVPESCKGIF